MRGGKEQGTRNKEQGIRNKVGTQEGRSFRHRQADPTHRIRNKVGTQEGKSSRHRQADPTHRNLGTLIDRVHRELTDADLEKIASTYHAWRGDSSHVVHASACSSALARADTLKREQRTYTDIAGFCKSATTAEIAAHGHILTPSLNP